MDCYYCIYSLTELAHSNEPVMFNLQSRLIDNNQPDRPHSAPSAWQRIKTRCLIPAMVLLSPLVSSCDILLDQALDCIDDDGPVFNKSILASPVLNQVYNETITVTIENEPRDDRFLYDFNFSGSLPEGITGRQEGTNGRRWFLSGTPIETGTFEFRLYVSVDEPSRFEDENSGLCYTSRSGEFELTVLEI